MKLHKVAKKSSFSRKELIRCFFQWQWIFPTDNYFSDGWLLLRKDH